MVSVMKHQRKLNNATHINHNARPSFTAMLVWSDAEDSPRAAERIRMQWSVLPSVARYQWINIEARVINDLMDWYSQLAVHEIYKLFRRLTPRCYVDGSMSMGISEQIFIPVLSVHLYNIS
jgi:hypothetical protein